MADRDSRSVHRWAVATAILTLLLIVAGGLVTSRDAGLAVPDWPLSFGTINPPRWYAIENVRTEHGHRVIAFLVASVTVLLGLRIWRAAVSPAARRLGAVAVGLVLLQAALGGLRVLHLSVDLAMIHGLLGQIFFAVVVALTVVTSPHWRTADAARTLPPTLRTLAPVITALVVIQLVVGIVIRHLGAGARPLAANGVFYLHVAGALLLPWLCLRMRGALRPDTGDGRSAREHLAYLLRRTHLLLGLVTAQILLGLGAFAATETMRYDRQATLLESWLPTLHVAVGAAILATSLALTMHALVPGFVLRRRAAAELAEA